MKSLKDLFKITNNISKEIEITNEDIFDTDIDYDFSSLFGTNVKIVLADKKKKILKLEPHDQNEAMVLNYNGDSIVHNPYLDYKTVIIGTSEYGAILMKCSSKKKIIDFHHIKFQFEDKRGHISLASTYNTIYKNLDLKGSYLNIENSCEFDNCNIDIQTLFFYNYSITFNKCKISYDSAKPFWTDKPGTLTGNKNITINNCKIIRK